MRHGLVVHLDLPGAIVSDHDDDRRLVADRCVDLEGVEAECAIPRRDENLPVREGEARGNTIGHSDADTAEGAGIEHGRCRQPDAAEGEEVATIVDDDRSRFEAVLDGGEHLVGMETPVLALGRRGHGLA